LIPIVEFLSPGQVLSWIRLLELRPDSAVSVMDWHSSALPDVLRSVFGPQYLWFRIAVPGVVGAIVLLYSIRLRNAGLREYALLMTLSIIGAPYGWHYDHAVLLVAQAALVFEAFAVSVSEGRRMWAIAFGINVFTVIVSSLWVVSFDQLFWYPLLTLLMFVTREKGGAIWSHNASEKSNLTRRQSGLRYSDENNKKIRLTKRNCLFLLQVPGRR